MKKIIILILVICTVIFTACRGETAPGVGVPFIGGTQGLSMEFLPDAPPREVFDGGDFPFEVVVKLQNKGEYDLAAANILISISGVLPQEFEQTASSLVKPAPEDLLPMRKDAEGNLIESNPVFVEFSGFNHRTSIVGAAQTFPIRASACYIYGTLGNALLCSRKNILAPATNGVCIIDEAKTIYNSGAPIQVVSLREQPRAADKIGFTFTIAHQGNGKIYERGSTCNQERPFKDRIFVDVKTGIPGLSCTGLGQGAEASGYITLFGEEKIITCAQQMTTQADFEFPVVIELTYDYEQDIQTSVVVKSATS